MRSETKIQDEQFASILMELVMQYAELTESHVFLLVETETSRRYVIIHRFEVVLHVSIASDE